MGVSVRGTVLAAAYLIAVAGAGRPAAAQVPVLPGGRTAQNGSLGSPPVPVSQRSSGSERIALEGAVDADTYLVGPGDGFTVVIGGPLARQVLAVVSADGRLIVPEAGSFAAAGRSLARVRAEVQAALRARYQNVTTDIALSAPREFYVHVSGRVPQPGRHLVPAVARVEDALVAASGTDIYSLAQYTAGVDRTETRWPALRSVSVERRSGASRVVDLMRYFATGDLDANPYLQDGDAVYIPSFDPLVEGVVVAGAVDRPGTYDVRDGDTAADLLTVAGEDPARIARVRRVRPGVAGVREVPYAEARTLDVRPRDQIYAVSSAPDADRVEVVGAVRFPGLYPVTSGETTVEALVGMAGGLREDALLRGLRLERRPRATATTAAGDAGADATPGATPGAATDAASGTASDVAVETDLLGGLFGRQFYERQTQRVARVALDPVGAVAGTQAVRLRGGDVLTVPFDNGLVRVYGRVLRGGYVPFVPGATAAAYVAQAGGVGASASTVYVVDAATEQLVAGGETAVQPGDAVFVNSLPAPETAEFAQLALQERQDAREDARDRRQSRATFFTAVLGVVGTAVSAVLAYAALTRN